MIFQRDELSKVICNIRIPNVKGEEVGTAIFIEKNSEPYLLTAEHVVKNINPQTYAVLSDQNGIPTKVMLKVLLGGTTFSYHGQADFAKAKIILSGSNSSFLNGRCFPYNQIDISNNPISKDIELTTIGFPLGLGAVGTKFSPLSYRTYAAAPSITLPRFDNKNQCDFIILELPSIGGYSGGPMFDLGYMISGLMKHTKEKTILHGLVHGTISDPTGGKLAAITPSKYLNGWL